MVQVPLAVAAIISVSVALKLPQRDTEDFRAKLKRIDFAGAITLVSGVFFLLLGLDRGGNVAWSDKLTIASLCAFVVLFVLFVFIETRYASEPFAPKAIVANPALVASYFANFFCAFSSSRAFHPSSCSATASSSRSDSSAAYFLLFLYFASIVKSACRSFIRSYLNPRS